MDVIDLLACDKRHTDAMPACAAGPPDAVHVAVVVRGSVEVDHVGDVVHVDSQGAKLEALVGELRGADADRALVFVRTKHGADRLVKRLGKQNVRAAAMHGNKSQSQREKALARFERGDVQTLVATDVAARGIDVPDVSHVINFDAPPDRDSYLHRVGRTGRAGRGGAGVSFVLADESRDMRRIASDLGIEPQLDGRHGSRDHRSSSRSRRRRRR